MKSENEQNSSFDICVSEFITNHILLGETWVFAFYVN